MANKINSWTTPDLTTTTTNNIQYVESQLGVQLQPNSVSGVLLSANAINADLAYQYQDFQSQQLLPSTATGLYLDKWANIYLINADNSRGRKVASYSSGTISLTSTSANVSVPAGTQLYTVSNGVQVTFETIAATAIGLTATPVGVRCLNAGSVGNLLTGTVLTLPTAIQGIGSQSAIVVAITGGTDAESDDELRARLLNRIQEPAMGGDANDWASWCTDVAGCTRAWCSPNEVCAGTVTIRVMFDDLRASTGGYPNSDDLQAVYDYLETKRPVTVAQYWVFAPEPTPLTCTITALSPDTAATRAAIQTSVADMIETKARPACAINGRTQPPATILSAWVSEAILLSAGVKTFTLAMQDFTPSQPQQMAVLGGIDYQL